VGFDEDLKDIQKQMERIIGGFFPNRRVQMPGETWSPPMDVYETDRDLVVIIEVAGAIPEDLNISFEGRVLTIRGRRESLADSCHTKCYQMEIDSGIFQKQIYIPFTVDEGKATSRYKDGLLRISLPKGTRKKKESIRISVK
jgi:HSP20 family protein